MKNNINIKEIYTKNDTIVSIIKDNNIDIGILYTKNYNKETTNYTIYTYIETDSKLRSIFNKIYSSNKHTGSFIKITKTKLKELIDKEELNSIRIIESSNMIFIKNYKKDIATILFNNNNNQTTIQLNSVSTNELDYVCSIVKNRYSNSDIVVDMESTI